MPENVRDLVAGAYPTIAADLLHPLLRLFDLCRKHCGGDLTKFVVMLSVALRTTMHRDFRKCAQEELLSGAMPVFPALPVNVRSIADTVDVPKETVRRKVTELIDAGWLVRDGGRLFFTASAYQQLAPVREQIEEVAARYYEVVAALRSSAADPDGSSAAR